MKCFVIVGYLLVLLRSLTNAQLHGGTTVVNETPSSDDTAARNVSEHITTISSQPNDNGNENSTLNDAEESITTTTETLLGSSAETEVSEVAVTPTNDTGDSRLDDPEPTYADLPHVDPEIDTDDLHTSSENPLTYNSTAVTEESENSTATPKESTEYALTPSPSSSNITEEELVTEVFTPDTSPEPVLDETTTVANSSEGSASSSEPTHTTMLETSSEEGDVPELQINISSSVAPAKNSTEMSDDHQHTPEMLTDTPTTSPDTTSSSSSPSSSGPVITPVATDSSGSCFGEAEVNTLLVVAVVVAVNVLAVVVTAVCVHRIVSRRLAWDPPPIYYNRSKRGEQARQRGQRSGRNLASDTECKAGEGGGAPGAHIPILITNEDGWVVPYNEQDQKKKKQGATTEDTGV